MWLPILLLVLSSLVVVAHGKHVYGKGYFGTQKIKEVTKFSFRPGESEVIGNITYYHHARGSLYLFMDTSWKDKYHGEADCEKVKHAHTRIPIGKIGRIGSGIGVANGIDPLYDEDTNKYNWQFTWKITHAVRTYGWYFAIADCKGFENGDSGDENDEGFSMSGTGKRRRRLKRNMFEFTLDLYNPDGDHLPADEHGLTTLYWVVTVLMVYFFWSTSSAYKKNGKGIFLDSHGMVKAFAFAYIFQILSMVFEIIHLWVYSSNGSGVFILDFFSESFEALSQLIISFSLICLANGWTLVDFTRVPKDKQPGVLKQLLNKPTLDDETPTLFVLIIMVFISTILQIINKVQDDDFLKFHDHDGLCGKFLLVQRILLAIVFLTSITGTIKSEQVRGQLQLEGFLQRLMFFGALWMFAFPVLVLLASLFAHYLQHRIVTGGVLVIQTACLTLMSKQILSNQSWYSKVSEVGSTGMLPGFGKHH